MSPAIKLKLGRCIQCWRRGYHEIRADGKLVGLFCDKHGFAAMEALAPIAEEVVVEYESGLRVAHRPAMSPDRRH